jgi:hypothetical protein
MSHFGSPFAFVNGYPGKDDALPDNQLCQLPSKMDAISLSNHQHIDFIKKKNFIEQCRFWKD